MRNHTKVSNPWVIFFNIISNTKNGSNGSERRRNKLAVNCAFIFIRMINHHSPSSCHPPRHRPNWLHLRRPPIFGSTTTSTRHNWSISNSSSSILEESMIILIPIFFFPLFVNIYMCREESEAGTGDEIRGVGFRVMRLLYEEERNAKGDILKNWFLDLCLLLHTEKELIFPFTRFWVVTFSINRYESKPRTRFLNPLFSFTRFSGITFLPGKSGELLLGEVETERLKVEPERTATQRL